MRVHYLLIIVILLIASSQSRRRSSGYSQRTSASMRQVAKGFATLLKSINDDDDASLETQKGMSGKQISKFDIRTPEYTRQLQQVSWPLVIILTLVCVGLVVYFLLLKSKSDTFRVDWNNVRQKHYERQKNYAALKAISQHGVHPDRANGNIYRIRL